MVKKIGYTGPPTYEYNGRTYRVVDYMKMQGGMQLGTVLGPNSVGEYYTIIELDVPHNRVLLGRTRPEDMQEAAFAKEEPTSVAEVDLRRQMRGQVTTGAELQSRVFKQLNQFAKSQARKVA